MTQASKRGAPSPHTPGASRPRFGSGDDCEAPQPQWHLMVLALSTTMTSAEPEAAGPRRRNLALEDDVADTHRSGCSQAAALPVTPGPASFVPCLGVVRCCPSLIGNGQILD